MFIGLSESVPTISFEQNPQSYQPLCLWSNAVKSFYLPLLCWLMYSALLIDLVLGLILYSDTQNSLQVLPNSKFMSCWCEQTSRVFFFLIYGSETQNESQACFSVSPRMSGVCFNEPPVQGWVINFDFSVMLNELRDLVVYDAQGSVLNPNIN